MHTRISEQLSDDIRRLAEDLRVPTSNLVRNVLEEVFTVVETVSDDVGELLDEVLEEAGAARERVRRRTRPRGRHPWRDRSSSWADVAEAEISSDEAAEARERDREVAARRGEESQRGSREPRPAFDEVIGWQPLVLNQTQECAGCGHTIRRGSRAFVGQTEGGLSRIALCKQCLSQ